MNGRDYKFQKLTPTKYADIKIYSDALVVKI